MGTFKRVSGNSLSLLVAQNRNIGAASSTSLTGVRLSLRCRLTQHQWTESGCGSILYVKEYKYGVPSGVLAFDVQGYDDPINRCG